MKVVLKEDVDTLGSMGDVVNVKSGYARNFLIPRGIALEASKRNFKAIEHEKRAIHERARKLQESAKEFGDKLSAMKLTLKAKAGEEEKLFGSVTSMDIADALKAGGLEVDKKKIVLTEPIKRLGMYAVEVKLGHNVTAIVNVEVIPDE